jgi:hypothetical protein
VVELQEIRPAKGLREDVCCVVSRAHTRDPEGLLLNKSADGVELHPDMFDRGVPSLIFGEAGGCIIVTQSGGRSFGEETEPFEELA